VVLKYQTPEANVYDDKKRWVFGVATNYLMNVHQVFNGAQPSPDTKSYEGIPTACPTYHVPGPREKHWENSVIHVPIHTRRSTFRLPARTSVPVIMVGPGTGVAPFRGFIQERVALARQAKERKGPHALDDWAPMYLFYGCRREDEDYLYKDEWPRYAKELDGKLLMDVAISRGPKRNADGSKIYVQNLIWERRDLIARAIVDQGAHIYICGEGKNMSKQVEETFAEIIAEYRNEPLAKGVDEMKHLKGRKRFLTDTWS
jgi:NADPH-ferrihemoprotein reductase